MSRKVVQPLRPNPQYGGTYKVYGTVSEDGVLGSYMVTLLYGPQLKAIRRTMSDSATGSWEFPYLAYRENWYSVVAVDSGASPKKAVIADRITPSPV